MIIIANDKRQTLLDIRANYLFDDSPKNIAVALEIPNLTAVMISNSKTAYNHHMRGAVPHYENLADAIRAYKLDIPKKRSKLNKYKNQSLESPSDFLL